MFRPGHHITLGLGVQQLVWRVEEPVFGQELRREGLSPLMGVRYGFHSSLLKKFGFVIGTAAKVLYDPTRFGGFKPGASFSFPSLSAGLVQNFVENTRAMAFVDLSASWFPWMTTRDLEGKALELGAIPDEVALSLAVDRFFPQGFALNVALGWRGLWYNRLGRLTEDSKLDHLVIQNFGYSAQLGVTWQVGGDGAPRL